MKLYTIGFAGKSAEQFFETLKHHGVKTLIDARLNNKSQLAGFTKVKDFPYLLKQVAGIEYRYAELLAPTKELLDGYKDGKIVWSEYETIYHDLLEHRTVNRSDITQFEDGCILCSEPTADQCHRRLAAEYLRASFPDQEIEIIHL